MVFFSTAPTTILASRKIEEVDECREMSRILFSTDLFDLNPEQPWFYERFLPYKNADPPFQNMPLHFEGIAGRHFSVVSVHSVWPLTDPFGDAIRRPLTESSGLRLDLPGLQCLLTPLGFG